jgi:uncharacterized protein with HEPN domain
VTAEKDTRDLARIVAMLQAIDDTIEDSSGGHREFLDDRKTQRALTLDLIHLTESASKVSKGFQDRHPLVPWVLMSQLRNHGLVHEYAELDTDGIWAFVRDELPKMARRLGSAKERAQGNSNNSRGSAAAKR